MCQRTLYFETPPLPPTWLVPCPVRRGGGKPDRRDEWVALEMKVPPAGLPPVSTLWLELEPSSLDVKEFRGHNPGGCLLTN